ncbi:MAG: hypothetical protein AAB785_01045 [Patescibacteria group bacterium]
MKSKEIDVQKNESIKLPRNWKNGKAYVLESNDIIVIKKYSVPDFAYVRSKLRKIKDKISQKDINLAIKAVRG